MIDCWHETISNEEEVLSFMIIVLEIKNQTLLRDRLRLPLERNLPKQYRIM
jgi:hypothetical protein